MDAESVAFQFHGTEAEHYRLKILGIRDYTIREDREVIYNDLICLLIENQVYSFDASTDPGSYYLKHPMTPVGCAKLQTGLWWYEKGIHLNIHAAFVQSEAVTVDRIDCCGTKVGESSGFLGINIHSGGPEIQVGRYSAGCQVIKCPEGPWGETWLRFFGMACSAMQDFKQSKVPYLLVDALKAKSV